MKTTATTTHTILLHQRLGRMGSCGPPPPRAAATPAAAAGTAAVRTAATSGAAAHQVLLPGQERHAACVAETARRVVSTPTTVPRL